MDGNPLVSSAVRSLLISIVASLAATYLMRRILLSAGDDDENSGNRSAVVVIVPVLVGNSGNQFGGQRTLPEN
jgi:hypothetical protein